MIKYLINCSFGHYRSGSYQKMSSYVLIIEVPSSFSDDFRKIVMVKLAELGFKFHHGFDPQCCTDLLISCTAQVLEIKPEIEQCVLVSYPRNDNDYYTINNYLKRGWLIQNTVPIGDSNSILITFYKNKS